MLATSNKIYDFNLISVTNECGRVGRFFYDDAVVFDGNTARVDTQLDQETTDTQWS